jgi:putative ABC transport system substrate-binding protein
MRRREFITLVGGATLTWPVAARAQQPERMRRIGVLMPFPKDNAEGRARIAAFLQELRQLGWIDGRNVKIEYRFDAGDLRKAATELLTLSPEVILASATPATAALQQATRTVPIVFCGGLRSGQRRLCRQSGQARRQHHWVREF